MICPQISQIYADWFIPNEVERSPETRSHAVLVQVLICGNWDDGLQRMRSNGQAFNLRMNKSS
jgi:hypothetical protein